MVIVSLETKKSTKGVSGWCGLSNFMSPRDVSGNSLTYQLVFAYNGEGYFAPIGTGSMLQIFAVESNCSEVVTVVCNVCTSFN